MHAIIAAYRFRTNVLDNKITTRSLLVVDTGSRKTTVAFARLSGTTDERRFNIEALSVINDLGGQSFDDVLIDLARKRFLRDYQMDIQKTNLRLMHKLTMECQKAKLILSTASEAQITLDSYDDVADITITRAEFEARTRRFVDKCIEAIDDSSAKDFHSCSHSETGGGHMYWRNHEYTASSRSNYKLCQAKHRQVTVPTTRHLQATGSTTRNCSGSSWRCQSRY